METIQCEDCGRIVEGGSDWVIATCKECGGYFKLLESEEEEDEEEDEDEEDKEPKSSLKISKINPDATNFDENKFSRFD